jgi:hypothetical protein
MSSLGFRTRTRGTRKQVGKRFPVLEKKKLPRKISIKRPTMSNNESGITDLTYVPPADSKDGYISFVFDGEQVASRIRLVDKEQNIGQWAVGEPVVFLDKKIGIGWIKYLSLHETLESYLEKRYGIDWNPYGHLLAEQIEHREFRKTHPESEWKLYDKQVRQVAHMNAGGKIGGSKINLQRAFDILAQRRRAINWQERGLNSVVQQRTQQIENKDFGRHLRDTINRHLQEK